MPNISTFNGIKINIYNGDHLPPHFHAVYNEHEALVLIENGVIYAGSLPIRQFKDVINWLNENRQWALNVFYELNPILK